MLTNTIVFITGASSGIGKACATYFAKSGAKLLLCARNMSKLQPVALELQRDYGVETHAFELDVSSSSQVKRQFQALPDAWKNVEVLINNAGLALGLDTLQDGTTEDWDVVIDTNVKGLLYITKAVLPNMIAKNAGHIINIGSTAGHQVYPKGAVYCATKFAVNALSTGLRLDLFGTKIRVSTVDPGVVETNFSAVRFKGDTERAKTVYQGFEPLTPDDVADAVLYCATRPPHVNISEIILTSRDQVSASMISRTTEKEKIEN